MIGTIFLLYLGTLTVISPSGSVTYRTEISGGRVEFIH